MEKITSYTSPLIQVLELDVETGFAASSTSVEIVNMVDGGTF